MYKYCSLDRRAGTISFRNMIVFFLQRFRDGGNRHTCCWSRTHCCNVYAIFIYWKKNVCALYQIQLPFEWFIFMAGQVQLGLLFRSTPRLVSCIYVVSDCVYVFPLNPFWRLYIPCLCIKCVSHLSRCIYFIAKWVYSLCVLFIYKGRCPQPCIFLFACQLPMFGLCYIVEISLSKWYVCELAWHNATIYTSKYVVLEYKRLE